MTGIARSLPRAPLHLVRMRPMQTTHAEYRLSQLDELEAESIHIIREVAAESERPVLLFSGGKDSLVMLHLALKAFAPARLPFPVLHIDTGPTSPRCSTSVTSASPSLVSS